jgi:hypothetical protein
MTGCCARTLVVDDERTLVRWTSCWLLSVDQPSAR